MAVKQLNKLSDFGMWEDQERSEVQFRGILHSAHAAMVFQKPRVWVEVYCHFSSLLLTCRGIWKAREKGIACRSSQLEQ